MNNKKPNSPLEAFLHWEQNTPDTLFLRQPIGGLYKTWTWKEAGNDSRRIASALKAQALPPKSKIAILSKNCAEWILADLAIMMAGHVSVPIYPNVDATTITQIIEHSESKILFIGKLDNFAKQKIGIPAWLKCINFSTYLQGEGDDWSTLLTKYEPFDVQQNFVQEGLATIMYTSGTSGKPKGVMISYEAISAILAVSEKDLYLCKNPRLFSYLPLSHIAERIGIEMVGLYLGASFSFAESIESFQKNLADTQPTIFFAVPRIWAKFQEKILEKIPQKKLDRLLSLPLVKSIVKKSIRKKLGLAKATHLYCGAAPVAVNLLLWFDKLGIEIFQAYAMTENSLYGTFNRHGANKYGTVGRPLSDMDLKLADDQEILIKNSGLMSGYYKEPALTNQSLKNNYFHTGDQGYIDAEGFLTITGRLKDIFKTDKAKYVAPGPIETLLMTDYSIEQVCVVGTGLPQPIALITLSPPGRLKSTAEISAIISQKISDVNQKLNSFERLEKAVIIKSDWTVENGLMTPSLKIRRHEIEKVYSPNYAEWYKTNGVIVWEN